METDKRFKILKRDTYSCQNKGCKYFEVPGIKNSSLEVHHLIEKYKFKDNHELHKELGFGQDTGNNLATLCSTCHRRYHCGVKILTINGKDYEAEIPAKFSWKVFKKEMKQIRREYRHDWGIKLKGEDIVILLYWLYVLSLR